MQTPEQAIEAVPAESGPDRERFRVETPGGGNQSDVPMTRVRHSGEAYEGVVKFKPPDDVPFADESGLAVPRGEVQYCQQFERLVGERRAD